MAGCRVCGYVFRPIYPVRGGARDFDGVADYMTVPNDAVLNFTGAFTLFTWMIVEAPEDNPAMFARERNTSSASDRSPYALLLGSGGDLSCSMSDADERQSLTNTAGPVSEDVWHPAAFRWDGTTGTDNMQLWLDGAQLTTSSQSGITLLRTSSTDLGLGMDLVRVSESDPQRFMWDGLLAEMAIWDLALSDSELVSLGQGVSPIHIQFPNLVLYVPILGISDPEPNYGQSGNATLTSAPPVADHAPVAPMFGYGLGWQGAFTVAAAATSFLGFPHRNQHVLLRR